MRSSHWVILNKFNFEVGQLFGNLPASNLLDHDWRNIEFKWKTFKAIYSMAFLLLGSFEVGLMITKGFRKGFDILYAGN